MTQASDLTIILASVLFLAIVLWILWLTVRGLRAERLDRSPPYLPDCFKDDYEPNKHESCHWEDFVIERAGVLLEQRRSGRWTGPPVTVRWDPDKIPGGTIVGNVAKWIEDEGERYGVHVERI